MSRARKARKGHTSQESLLEGHTRATEPPEGKVVPLAAPDGTQRHTEATHGKLAVDREDDPTHSGPELGRDYQVWVNGKPEALLLPSFYPTSGTLELARRGFSFSPSPDDSQGAS